MKHEDRAIARRQLRNRFIKRDAVNDGHCVRVLSPLHDLLRRFALFRCLLVSDTSFSEVHQDLIDCQAMKPRRKSRLAAKASYFSKELYEDLLRKVFGLRDVLRHAKAERIDATVVALVKLLEGLYVARRGLLSQSVIRRLFCLGFGCRHLSLVHFGQLRNFRLLKFLRLLGTKAGDARTPDFQKEARLSASLKSNVGVRERLLTFRMAVMLCFPRVVALFCQKIIFFVRRNQHYRAKRERFKSNTCGLANDNRPLRPRASPVSRPHSLGLRWFGLLSGYGHTLWLTSPDAP